ncbi:hypothetical protein RJ639_025093, partial [Escallonia herrerae]
MERSGGQDFTNFDNGFIQIALFVWYCTLTIDQNVVEHGLGHLPFTEKQVVTPTGIAYLLSDHLPKIPEPSDEEPEAVTAPYKKREEDKLYRTILQALLPALLSEKFKRSGNFKPLSVCNPYDDLWEVLAPDSKIP